jgi:primosomal protein N' (replication factor Y)
VSGDAPLTATVVPDVTGLDKSFDYLVPAHLQPMVRVGTSVRVPLHGRRVGGWVVRVGPPTGDVPVERLVPIISWTGEGPAADLVDLADWAADRWGAPRIRPFLVTASPPTRVRAVGRGRPAVVRHRPDASVGVRRLLTDHPAGGVVRVTPTDDVMPVLSAALELGRVVVVHPSPAQAQLLAARLRGQGSSVAVMPHDWAAAASGVDVVIGGRATVWAPAPGMAVLVVLDEHDESLQEERSPTWHARDVAIERTRRAGVPCLLVSPCPTVTALKWSGTRWLRPSPADEREGWPTVEVVDRSDTEPWKRSLVTSPLIEVLRDPSKRVVCVHNTPGRARLLACRSCRSLVACERCDASLAQADDGLLHCRRCATVRPPVCQVCGSTALANVRPGVTRLRDELEAAAGRSVTAVTAQLAADETLVGDVFVGTEAVLHRVREADVVAFLDLDSELLAPRYRAGEQAFALLVRAARLVGPRRDGGRLLVQTHLPQHEVVQAALHADPGRVAKLEAERRRSLMLPPFAALGHVSGAGAAEFVADTHLASAPDGDGFLVRAASWDDLGPVLAATPRPPHSRLRVEVDPARR